MPRRSAQTTKILSAMPAAPRRWSPCPLGGAQTSTSALRGTAAGGGPDHPASHGTAIWSSCRTSKLKMLPIVAVIWKGSSLVAAEYG